MTINLSVSAMKKSGRARDPSEVTESHAIAKTDLKKLGMEEFRRSSMQSFFHGKEWRLIFTLRYTPQVQPVELVWAYGKNYVGRCYKLKRSKEYRLENLFDWFYGSADGWHLRVQEHIPSIIENVRKECNPLFSECYELEEAVGKCIRVKKQSDHESDDESGYETEGDDTNFSVEDDNESAEGESEDELMSEAYTMHWLWKLSVLNECE